MVSKNTGAYFSLLLLTVEQNWHLHMNKANCSLLMYYGGIMYIEIEVPKSYL
jgi:hypothetical protein